ncbi:MAG: hypothetical protein U0531_14700 [Dehalococcoidia bacterium]
MLDIGEETEGPYAAVEEVAGAGLGAVVAARGPLPAAHVADIVRAIADALDYLHDRGLIHSPTTGGGADRPERAGGGDRGPGPHGGILGGRG